MPDYNLQNRRTLGEDDEVTALGRPSNPLDRTADPFDPASIRAEFEQTQSTEDPVVPDARADTGRLDPFSPEAIRAEMGIPERLPTAPAKSASDLEWADYGRSIMAGAAEVGTGMGWIMKKLGGVAVGQDAETLTRWGKGLQERSSRSADAWRNEKLEVVGMTQEGLSENARRGMETAFLGEGAIGDKFNRALLMAASSLPATATGLGGGVLLTSGFLKIGLANSPKIAASLGFGLGEAGIAAPMAGGQIDAEIGAMTHEQLLESPEYVAAFEALGSEEKARDLVADAASGKAAAMTLLSTFIFSAPLGALAGRMTGAIPGLQGTTRLGRGTTGALGEAGQEFLQSGSEAMAGNIAMEDAGFDRDLMENVLEEAVGGALSGALLGGPLGLASGSEADVADGPEAGVLRDLENQAADLEQGRADAQVSQEAQDEARRQSAAAGGDLLDQELAAARVAAEGGERMAAERVKMYEDRQRVEADREYAEAQVAEDEARAAIQEEAAAQYEQQQARIKTEEAHAAAEAETAARIESETQEAEYQREQQKGAEIAAEEAATPTLADVAPVELTQGAVPVVEESKPPPPAPRPKPKPSPALLEDQRPDFAVTPEGEAIPKGKGVLEGVKVDVAENINPDLATPTVAQQDAENYKVGKITGEQIGHPKIGKISIENTPGSERGKGRKVGHYVGRILGTKGADWNGTHGHIDSLHKADDAGTGRIFVVDQVDAEGQFDEHKVVFGAKNAADAARVHKQTYARPDDMKVGAVTEMTEDEFAEWAYADGMRDAPVGKLKAEQRKLAQKISAEADAQVTVEASPSRFGPGSRTITLTTPEGERIGGMRLREEADTLQVSGVLVDQKFRQKGHGQRLIVEALKTAYRAGKKLVSDEQVTVAQLRAYDGLRSEGFIIEYADEAAVEELMVETSNFAPEELPREVLEGNGQPVVTRIDFGPDMALKQSMLEDLEAELLAYGVAPDRVQQLIQPILDTMPEVKVVVLRTMMDGPEYMQRAVLTGAISQHSEGLYDPILKTTYLISDNMMNESTVIETLLHEVVGHHGTEILLGDRFGPVMDEIYESVKDRAGFKAIVSRYGFNLEEAPERRSAADEYVAHMAETDIDSPLLQKVVDAIRQVLRGLGLVKQWSDNDIRALLRDSRSGLKGKALNKVYLTSEVQIAETGEVVDLEERADVVLKRLDQRTGVIEKVRACL